MSALAIVIERSVGAAVVARHDLLLEVLRDGVTPSFKHALRDSAFNGRKGCRVVSTSAALRRPHQWPSVAEGGMNGRSVVARLEAERGANGPRVGWTAEGDSPVRAQRRQLCETGPRRSYRGVPRSSR